MTGVALPLIAREFHLADRGKGHHQCRQPHRHPGRRGAAWRALRLFRPQARCSSRRCSSSSLPGRADPVQRLHIGVDLPVRPGACARLRLPDGAHDHLGEYPQSQSRQVRAGCVWLPGTWSAGRHRRWMPRAGAASAAGCLAVDVRDCADPCVARDDRAVFRGRKRQLAGGPRRAGGGGEINHAAARAQSAVSESDIKLRSTLRPRKRGASNEAILPGAVQQPQPARHHLRFGALVHPGSEHLWHRHFHAGHPGGRASAASPITSAASAT